MKVYVALVAVDGRTYVAATHLSVGGALASCEAAAREEWPTHASPLVWRVGQAKTKDATQAAWQATVYDPTGNFLIGEVFVAEHMGKP